MGLAVTTSAAAAGAAAAAPRTGSGSFTAPPLDRSGAEAGATVTAPDAAADPRPAAARRSAATVAAVARGGETGEAFPGNTGRMREGRSHRWLKSLSRTKMPSSRPAATAGRTSSRSIWLGVPMTPNPWQPTESVQRSQRRHQLRLHLLAVPRLQMFKELLWQQRTLKCNPLSRTSERSSWKTWLGTTRTVQRMCSSGRTTGRKAETQPWLQGQGGQPQASLGPATCLGTALGTALGSSAAWNPRGKNVLKHRSLRRREMPPLTCLQRTMMTWATCLPRRL
mmetsp:Transcript_10150/g.29168  ORF Transcript_10150/g.29168 Transcript_10150/m.29168 type:complete len:281 (-) Transcript_10150:2497-3339(-)